MSRIAIVGSGISGLVSAYTLQKRGHEVHLIEAAPRLGGHTATVDVEVASGRYAIDTGFIVFNDWTYPEFIRIMNELGVASQESLMSFSVKSEKNQLEYNGADLGHLFAQKRNLLNPKFYRMLTEILRFNRESLETLDGYEGFTLGQYLTEKGYSRYFTENYIFAMGAAIWSASYAQMETFPIRFFVRFFKNHGMLSVDDRPKWRVIQGGSRNYIQPMIRSFQDKIRLNTPVLGVRRQADAVELSLGGAAPTRERFDYVVLACHSDQSLKMLENPTPQEREILGAIHYQPNDVILHTDTSVLPKTRKTWAAWNYFISKQESDRVALTYHMNILQGISSPETFLVSLNIGDQIDPKKIISKYVYDHPVFSPAAVAAQARVAEISHREGRILYAGAYWGYGFHEDGVRSALRAVEAIP